MSFYYFSYGNFTDISRLKDGIKQIFSNEDVSSLTTSGEVAFVTGLRLSFNALSRDSPRLGVLNVTPEAPHRPDVDLSKYRHAAQQLLPPQSPAPLGGTVYGVVHTLPSHLKPLLLEVVGREGSYNKVSEQWCHVVSADHQVMKEVRATVIAALDLDSLERQFLLNGLKETWIPLPSLQEHTESPPSSWGSGRWPSSHWCNWPSSFHLLPSPAYQQELTNALQAQVQRRTLLPREYQEAYRSLLDGSFPTRDTATDKKEEKTWYLAYGSNLSWEQVCVRIGPAYQRRPVKLDRYVLVANKSPYSAEYASFGYYNVEPVERRRQKEAEAAKNGIHITPCVMPDYVCGAAYEMSVSQLEMMDQFEQRYTRELHPCVDLETGEVRHCWVYIAEDTHDDLLPSKEYLGRVLEGRDILPEEYIKGIEQTETNPLPSPRQAKRLRKEL